MSISSIVGSSGSSQSEMLTRIRGSGQRPSDEDMASRLIQDHDGDGDGLLSMDELGILDQEQFDNADTDGDGYLSEEEILADMEQRHKQMQMMAELGQLMQGAIGESTANSILGQYDADGDGSLSMKESGLSEEVFGAVDADGDGLITSAELEEALQQTEDMAAMMPPPPEGAQQASAQGASESGGSGSSDGDDEEYDEYDTNQDGVVSMDELRQAFLNGDLSLEEYFAETGDAMNGQSPLMRIAMNAYQMQSDLGSNLELLSVA